MTTRVSSLEDGPPRTGLAVSGAMHLLLFAVIAFGFARAPSFDDAPESIPVETITTTELNEIMEGEKTAKPAPAPAKAAPEKPAPAKPAPEPPTPPEPPPPEPPTRPEPPKPEPPPPEPPVRPEPPKPEPPKDQPPAPEPPKRPEPPKPEPPKPQAEAPSPPVKPRPPKPEETPRPPERPHVAKTEEPPKPDKFKPDEIAKALAKDAPDKPHPKAPAYDPSAISKLIGQTKTADATPHAAVQGLADHHAPRMSVSLENGLNEWFRDSYKNCWSLPPTNPTGENYVFDVRVTFNPDGSLAARPVMLNPPHDPEWRAHADSVMRAVARCNPLHIPTQYTPYFDQWRSKTIHFDPASAEG